MELTIELQGRWLVAGISQIGWLESLQPEQLRDLSGKFGIPELEIEKRAAPKKKDD